MIINVFLQCTTSAFIDKFTYTWHVTDVGGKSPAIVPMEVTLYTRQGNFGVEFVLACEIWRINQDGKRVFASLLRQLSPYQGRNIRTRALKRLADRSACLLAVSDLADGHHGHTVGLARLEVHHSDKIRYGEIHDVVVSRKYRRLGIGKALAQKALGVADKLGLPYAEVNIKPARTCAVQMFQLLGFKLIATADPAVPDSANRYRFEFPKPKQPQKLAH